MASELTGLAAVLAEAGAGDGLLPDVAEQLDLLGLRAVAVERRGRGRPPGARNRSVQEVADYLLSKYADPLEGLIQMANAPVEHLAAALGCERSVAFAEKRQCMIAVLPYLHRRQPLAVDVSIRAPVYLTIVDVASDAGVTMKAAQVVDVVEYQGVNDGGESDV